MKPQQTVPLLSTLAPLAAAAPPIALVALLGAGLIWLLSSGDKAEPKPADTLKPQPQPKPQPVAVTVTEAKPSMPLVSPPLIPTTYTPAAAAKRVTREDLAEALAYGARQFTRKETVAALEALGFRKTAAYKALSPEGKFSELIELTPDGLIEWIG